MEKQKGSGLIFAVVLMFVILGMVVTLSSITILETKMSQKTKSSVGAFYNSEAGVEWALNKIATGTGDYILDYFGTANPGSGISCPTSDCKVYLLDKDGIVITSNLPIEEVKAVRSVGTQDTGEVTQRAIEAAVAAGEGMSYTQYCYDSNLMGVPFGSPVCPASVTIGTQGPCLAGFKAQVDLGDWGNCYCTAGTWPLYSPLYPGNSCGDYPNCGPTVLGRAYLCSK